MDAERFDRLTKRLATRVPRRSLLRGALATGAAWLIGRPQPGHALAQSECAPFFNISCQSDVECQGVVGAPPVCFQLACCGGICEDITVSGTNCGGCGITCPPNATCEGGQCTSACQAPLVECNGTCVDTSSDPNHCGECFAVCAPGTTCVGGICTCEGGLSNCFGACVDLSADPFNCGACGGTCPDGTVCAGGTCVCANGLTSCDGVCVDIASDPNNCGDCFAVCGPETTCVGGICTCSEWLANCSGICVTLASDPANCGACGVICPDGGACVDGTCELICPAGTEACNGACVDTRVDPANCGACGNRCPDGTSCEDGQCPVWEFDETAETVLEVPGPELCIAPRPSRDDLQRLAVTSSPTPIANTALSPVLTSAEADALMATGTEVDEERRQAGLAVVRSALGCENAGDPLRELGEMTDAGIRATLVDRGWTPEVIGLLGDEDTPPAAPLPHDRRLGIAGAVTMRALPDGRLVARVPLGDQATPSPEPPTPNGPGERIYVLVDLPNGLKIDQKVHVNPNTGVVMPRTGSLAVQLEVCPPGMTHEDFVPSACEPVQIEGFAPAIYAKPGDYDDAPRPYAVENSYFGTSQGLIPGLAMFSPPWNGYYMYIYGLDLGRTYWIELRVRGADPWGHPGVVPGTVGLSMASGPSVGRTFWGAALTVSQPDAVVRAYYFRSAECGRTCPGDQEECVNLLDGTSVWVDLSLDRGNCGRCGNACPGGQTCVEGVCA